MNISTLAAQPFLKGMTEQQLELLGADSYPTEFRPNERILSEGGVANRFYLITEGRVEVESRTFEGEAVAIETLGPGDVVGWSWLLPPYYWQFDARAAVHTKAICFYGTHLGKVCEENHDIGYELMKRISEIVVKRLQSVRLKLVGQNNDSISPPG